MTAPTIYSVALQQAIGDDRISPLFAGEVDSWLTDLVERCEKLEANGDAYRAGQSRLGELVDRYLDESVAAEAKLAAVEQYGAGRAVAEVERLSREIEMHGEKHIAMYAEIERLRAALREIEARFGCSDGRCTDGRCRPGRIARGALANRYIKPENDLDLLAKLASGEGGRRTGAFRRAGYLDWSVTEAGLKALEGHADGLHFAGRLEEEAALRKVIAEYPGAP